MKIKHLYLLFIISTCVFSNVYGQIQIGKAIVTNAEADNLVKSILVGTGVTVSNVNWGGFYFTDGSGGGQISSFTTGSIVTNLGLRNGILLSTGNNFDAPGPNNVKNKSTRYWYLSETQNSDANIESLIGCSFCTYDAATLEFDFVPASNVISFRYVFASEEYPEYVCSKFNDVFGFFVSGPKPGGGNYAVNNNIAIIPDTTLPVAINTVNPGVPGSEAEGGTCISLDYSNFYVNNGSGTTPQINPFIQYDGFTTVMTAKIDVIPCSTYHIKLAIADVADDQLDSGVFLEANSFSTNAITVNTAYVKPNIDSVAVKGCNNAIVTFNLSKPPLQDTIINYSISGTAVNGQDYESLNGKVIIPIDQKSGSFELKPFLNGVTPGNLTFIFTVNISSCTQHTFTIKIKDNPELSVTSASDATICKGKSATINSIPTGGFGSLSYLWSNNAGTTKSITVSPEDTTTYILTVTDACGTKASTNVNVNVNPLPEVIVEPAGPVKTCSGDTLLLTANSKEGYMYQWRSGSSNISGATNVSFSPTVTGAYSVVITDANTCSNTSSVIQVIINTPPTATITAADTTIFCKGNNVMLNANTGNGYNYQWFKGGDKLPGVTSAAYLASDSGSYIVVVKNNADCEATSSAVTVTVNPLPDATIEPNGSLNICSDETLKFTVKAGEGYSYQWKNNSENILGATGNTFTADSSGVYSVVITNSYNCTATSEAVSLNVNYKPEALITPLGPLAICKGESITFSTNEGVGYLYQWLIDNIPVAGANANKFNPNSAGGIKVVISINGICPDTSEAVEFNINPLPEAVIKPSGNVKFCSGDNVTLEANTGEGLSYQWKNKQDIINGATNSSFTTDKEETYSVIVENTFNCYKTSESVQLNEVNWPQALIDPPGPFDLCSGKVIKLNAKTGNEYLYQWLLNNSPISGATKNTYETKTSGKYSVIITIGGICPDTSNISDLIYTASLTKIADIIIPERENCNSYLRMEASCLGKVGIMIFDRWGLKVFDSNYDFASEYVEDGYCKGKTNCPDCSYYKLWDGKNNNGENLPAGVYYYIIKAYDIYGNALSPSDTGKLKGSVTLIR